MDDLELFHKEAIQTGHRNNLSRLTRAFLLILGSFFLSSGDALPAENEKGSIVLHENIKVLPDETVEKDLVSFGGNILIEGKVRGDVFSLGGEIVTTGRVEGSVVSFGGTVRLQDEAFVQKDVIVLGGTLEAENDCRILGDTIAFPGNGRFSNLVGRTFPGKGQFYLSPFILGLKLFLLFFWLCISPLVILIFPQQVARGSLEMEKNFVRIGLIGIVAMIFTFLTLLFFILLSVILIGFPLLILLFAAASLIKIFGTVVVFHFIGKKLGGMFGKTRISEISAVFLGLAIMALLRFIPILNLPAWFLVNIFAFGIVLATKFGTGEPWFRKTQRAIQG